MFNERLRELRESKGLSMDRLVEMYNEKYDAKMNKSTLSRYENGLQDPIYTVVVNLAEFFSVSVDYLIGKELDVFSYPNIRPITKKKYRMLGKIACGEPIYANEDYETYIEASADINADFCLTAQGDSMINARIFDGDIVFIKAQSDVDNGEIAAVIIGDEVTLKRVYKYNNRLELRAENPTYEPLNYEGLELENIRILGKAVAFQSYVK